MSNPAAGASPTAPAQQAMSLDIPPTSMSTITTSTSTCTTTTTTSFTSTSTSVSACHRPTASQTSVDSNDRASLQSQATHQEYLDSLVVPSKGELERIAEIQKHRETEHRRRSREQRLSQQQSLVACDRAAAAAAISPVSSNRPTSSHAKKEEKGKKDKEKKGNNAKQDGKQDHVGFFRGLDVFVAQSRAAVVIQRHYRGYRARREMKGFNINANTRWVHAIREARYRELTRPRARAELGLSAEQASAPVQQPFDGTEASSTRAMRNWKKATGILKYASGDVDSDDEAGDGDDDDDDDDDSDYDSACDSDAEGRENGRQRPGAARVRRRKDALMMGLQYFLEMIDPKHRYGANLRVYHEEWKRSDTNENFFYWLDYGEGRLVDTTACPRARLDREQVRYLSREERQYYQVKIDTEGRLCWAKNGARIDTTAKWKDSIHGIVPVDDPTPAFKPVLGDAHGQHGHDEHGDLHPRHRHFDSGSEPDYDSDSDSDSSVSESELEAARAAKYNIPDNDEAVGARPSSSGSGKSGGSAVAKKSHHFSPATVVDALLRKSVQKNTWIFVADTSFRLYVGLKDSGTFQHSSFLRGARISAAGLIKIRNGRLVALSPLSGHYRPPVSNFRSFMSALREEGADMRHVAVSKAYVVLVGLEAYMRTRQRGKKLLRKLHPHAHNHDHGHDHDGGREHDQEKKPEQAEDEKTATSTTGRLLQKLHIRSAPHDDNGHGGT
ncbi:IQ calmodulin-binding protein motif protein [Sporothrix schenckii 1099-18]|uniref:IQ domain-containing protein IQM6 n=2 Tax=Sporothrix schenckii TaxID=29908 RepID=U7PW73_SPOS1|nr:IQ calmodulin-binding protein motif protein [Sporothrix schenckii 1099-18]ERS99186.1 hypothetical protein HMPREF1624_04382 [Sporothrix schenckii ATCC 58251]KJR83139.1 IQ calmodulin-binding protein motif protein [Sporothrix schenckii 1099-18]